MSWPITKNSFLKVQNYLFHNFNDYRRVSISCWSYMPTWLHYLIRLTGIRVDWAVVIKPKAASTKELKVIVIVIIVPLNILKVCLSDTIHVYFVVTTWALKPTLTRTSCPDAFFLLYVSWTVQSHLWIFACAFCCFSSSFLFCLSLLSCILFILSSSFSFRFFSRSLIRFSLSSLSLWRLPFPCTFAAIFRMSLHKDIFLPTSSFCVLMRHCRCED